MNVLVIDNHDSFVFNLVDEFAARGCDVQVYRNTASADDLDRTLRELARPRLLVLSPGPGAPADAGCCPELVRRASAHTPIFGVCLGHQVIVEAFGGEVGRAPDVVHGRATRIHHDGRGLFRGLDSSLAVGRYHSLVASDVPDVLEVSACADDDVPMAIRHRTLAVFGVQFHPESILTAGGAGLIDNLLTLIESGTSREAS